MQKHLTLKSGMSKYQWRRSHLTWSSGRLKTSKRSLIKTKRIELEPLVIKLIHSSSFNPTTFLIKVIISCLVTNPSSLSLCCLKHASKSRSEKSPLSPISMSCLLTKASVSCLSRYPLPSSSKSSQMSSTQLQMISWTETFFIP